MRRAIPRAPPGADGLHLLARAIALPLDPALRVTAPAPEDMPAAIAACGGAA